MTYVDDAKTRERIRVPPEASDDEATTAKRPETETDTGSPKAPATPKTKQPRRRPRRWLAVLAAAVVIVAAAGAGGKFAWDATAVRRNCPLQTNDVATLVPWTVAATTTGKFPSPLQGSYCSYDSAELNGDIREHVTTSQGKAEGGETPAYLDHCLSGGYWEGRGLLCMFVRTSGLETVGSVNMAGTRFNGNNTFRAEVTCAQKDATVDTLSRDVKQRCLDQLFGVMSLMASRLEVTSDTATPQDPLSLDFLLSRVEATDTPSAGEAIPPTETPNDSGASSTPAPEPTTPKPTASGAGNTAPRDLSGDTVFEHFTVAVVSSVPGSGTTDIEVQVCLTSLTKDAVNGSTRISRDPWTAKTTSGTVLKPVAATGAGQTFPSQSRAKPGECATGILRFPSESLASISYHNGQGDDVTFP